MGCGGSRTDAVDTLDSWTKETESTWLTSTDADIPLSSIHSLPSEDCEKTISRDFFNDGFPPPAQAYLKVCSSVCEVNLDDVTPRTSLVTPASVPQEAALPTSGNTVQ
ncbi:uncharacterized protein baalcb [Thalassophryne amazonica]|uniref:uncharacterized protein baalcb n=1 Tax=Thalassophryne amazonica TaxID=390379 RepID=UPI001470EB47|nr:uncharacterized protein baalcb [Thalassophryne amazonica]